MPILASKDHIKLTREFTKCDMNNAQVALDSGESNTFESCTTVTT